MAKAELKVIGSSPARMGGVERVIGKGVYGIDLMLKDQLHGAILLPPGAVYTYHMNAVGYGMAALNGLPCIVLLIIGGFILVCCPADRCWVKQNFCTH